MKENAKVYRVSAMRLTKENLIKAQNYRFARASHGHILIYDCEIPEGAVIIEKKDADKLSREDIRWITDANIALVLEYAAEHPAEIENRIRCFMDFWEREHENGDEK